MGFLKLQTNIDLAGGSWPDSYYIDKQFILNTNKVGQVIINSANELSIRYILPGSASLNINLTISKSFPPFAEVPLTTAELQIERQKLEDAILLQSPGSVWRPSFDPNIPSIYFIYDVTIV